MELGARCLLGWSNDSPSEEEDDEQIQEEDDKPEGDEHEEAEGRKEEDPTNLEEQGETGLEADPQRQSQKWGSIMDDEQPLAFNDPRLVATPLCVNPAGAGVTTRRSRGGCTGLRGGGTMSQQGGRAAPLSFL